MDSGDRSSTRKVRVAIGVDVVQSHGVWVRRDIDTEFRVVPAFEGPSGDPEEQRDIVRLVVCDREVGKPVLVEIRDSQVHRILAGATGPRHIEAAINPTSQHEDALAAGNHEVQPPVAIQVVGQDRAGRASDNGVDLSNESCLAVAGGGVARARAAEARTANPREAREVVLITIRLPVKRWGVKGGARGAERAMSEIGRQTGDEVTRRGQV